MTLTLRPSSIDLYETHWQRFVAYCHQKNINVFQVHSQPAVLSLFSDFVSRQCSAIYWGFASDFSRFGTASLEIWPSYASQREDAFTGDPVGKTCTAEHHASVEPSLCNTTDCPFMLSVWFMHISLFRTRWCGRSIHSEFTTGTRLRTSHGSRVEGVGFILCSHLPYCPGRSFVCSILEVIWCVPEELSMWFGTCCWCHGNVGCSSRGSTCLRTLVCHPTSIPTQSRTH